MPVLGPGLCTDPTPGVLHCGVHVIVVGCGRVGSGLALSLSAEGHSVAVLDKSPRAFRRLKDWDGPCIVGSGFDRDDLEKAGALAGRRAGRGHQRRQHQHPDRAHRPGDLQDPQRGGPHLRPPAGRDLPAPRHPDRGHGHVDHRPGPPAPAARRGRRPTGPTPPGASRWSTARCPTPGPAGRCATSRSPGSLSLVAVTRAGVPRLDARELVGQEGDVLHLAVLDDALRELDETLARRRRPQRGRP